MDRDGVLRVGGRLQGATMGYSMKHPIILPKRTHVTNLIIRHHHENIHHQGRGLTINELRANGLWTVGCSRAVSSYILKCTICRRLRGKTDLQKMKRMHNVPPFTHVDEFMSYIYCLFGKQTISESLI